MVRLKEQLFPESGHTTQLAVINWIVIAEPYGRLWYAPAFQ
jgi:hypothetical protein